MANQALTQELVTKAQLNSAVEFLDHWLRVYSEAVFILSCVVFCLLACVIFREFTVPKTDKKAHAYSKDSGKPRLLQTEP